MTIQIKTVQVCADNTATFNFDSIGDNSKIISYVIGIGGFGLWLDGFEKFISEMNIEVSTVNISALEITVQLDMNISEKSGGGGLSSNACFLTCVAEVNYLKGSPIELFNIQQGESKEGLSNFSSFGSFLSGFNFPSNGDSYGIQSLTIQSALDPVSDGALKAAGICTIYGGKESEKGSLYEGFIGLPSKQDTDITLEVVNIEKPISDSNEIVSHEFSSEVIDAAFLLSGFSLPNQGSAQPITSICAGISLAIPYESSIKIEGKKVSVQQLDAFVFHPGGGPKMNLNGLLIATVPKST
ncbi:hypothetical protein MED121_12670 [Marinomonas sp. MED121]|uniref:hypothetical protein n=1 Tax=Marinomonas sp. MED121 TaxID=314277 RepID=UPI000068FFF9|nr:hypothetical protein [Marinomonas sp. MED121]EAQ66780.1 hypothetical protein MED121_12670 [Marinomonas sp. MED121]